MTISFEILGKPATAGSKRSFAHAKTGRIVTVDDCERGQDWRSDVRAAAIQARGKLPASMLEGPLSVEITFCMKRPSDHFNSRGQLKPTAPSWHTKRPDALKLARAIEDALTGILWADDAQIAEERLLKKYAATWSAYVVVQEISA